MTRENLLKKSLEFLPNNEELRIKWEKEKNNLIVELFEGFNIKILKQEDYGVIIEFGVNNPFIFEFIYTQSFRVNIKRLSNYLTQ